MSTSLKTRRGFYCADLKPKCFKNILWTKYLLSWSHCNSLTHFQSHSSTHRLVGMAMNSTRGNRLTWEQASWYLPTAQSRWVPDKESSVPTIFAATTLKKPTYIPTRKPFQALKHPCHSLTIEPNCLGNITKAAKFLSFKNPKFPSKIITDDNVMTRYHCQLSKSGIQGTLKHCLLSPHFHWCYSSWLKGCRVVYTLTASSCKAGDTAEARETARRASM